MLIRRVTAPTRQEAYEKLRKELGPEVEIVHAAAHKRGGIFGFFRREWIEVVGVRADRSSGEARSHPTVEAARQLISSGVAEIAPSPQPLPDLPAQLAPPPPSQELVLMKDEILQIKQQLSVLSELKDLKDVLSQLKTAPAAQPAEPVSAPFSPSPEGPAESDCPGAASDVLATGGGAVGPMILIRDPAPVRDLQYVELAMQTLRANELADDLICEVRQYLVEALSERELRQPSRVRERAIEYLASRLSVAGGLGLVGGQKGKLVALVGPTGVGKTTTLAKLAGGLMFNHKLDVAFITIDTYRIAAPEQLKKYAEIVEVPVKVVFKPEEMIELVHGFRNKDVILIDTVGRSPRNREDLLDLKKFLEFGIPIETHLLVSALTKLSDLRGITAGFKELGFQKVLVTKTDETSCFGSVVSLLAGHREGASYMTTGQCVPDDILEADAVTLASMAFSKRGLTPELLPPRPQTEASDGVSPAA